MKDHLSERLSRVSAGNRPKWPPYCSPCKCEENRSLIHSMEGIFWANAFSDFVPSTLPRTTFMVFLAFTHRRDRSRLDRPNRHQKDMSHLVCDAKGPSLRKQNICIIRQKVCTPFSYFWSLTFDLVLRLVSLFSKCTDTQILTGVYVKMFSDIGDFSATYRLIKFMYIYV